MADCGLGGTLSVHVLTRRLGRLGTVLLVAATLFTVDITPAVAAGPVGYVRLAHLSPDTPNVDVYLSAVGGGSPQVFPGVGYGVASEYLSVPVGTYAVAMRGAGAPASDPPVLTTNVTVDSGKAYTVAGVGKHADLGLRVINDDLSAPPSGKAKIRIIQASVRAPVLTVSIAGGESIASGVSFATTTDYLEVRPGKFTLNVQGANSGPAATLSVHLNAGEVYSLLVLDAKTTGLTAELKLDAGRKGDVPSGGMATGAGGTAGDDPPLPWALGAAALLLLGAGGFVVYRRRRSAATG
jgi:hypothetical protein